MHQINISNRLLKRYFKRPLKRRLKRSMCAIALRARAAWLSSHEVNAQPEVGPEHLEIAERHIAQAEKLVTGWRDSCPEGGGGWRYERNPYAPNIRRRAGSPPSEARFDQTDATHCPRTPAGGFWAPPVWR